MDLDRQQKQQALFDVIKKLKEGNIPVEDESLPIGEPVPVEPMDPELAKKLDEEAAKEAAARNPASEAQVDINGDKVAVPLKGFMPKGSYVGNKVGQQESPDMTGVASAPEMDSKAARLAKIKALFQNK